MAHVSEEADALTISKIVIPIPATRLNRLCRSERRNLESLDLCELVGFCVETEKPVASEKTGGNDVEDIVGSETVLCSVSSGRLLEERGQGRNIHGCVAQEAFRRQIALESSKSDRRVLRRYPWLAHLFA